MLIEEEEFQVIVGSFTKMALLYWVITLLIVTALPLIVSFIMRDIP